MPARALLVTEPYRYTRRTPGYAGGSCFASYSAIVFVPVDAVSGSFLDFAQL